MSRLWILPFLSSISANRMPPVSLMRLSERRRRVREVFPSRASTIERAPSSPILVLPRSRCVMVLFWESTPARLTPTSSPRGLFARDKVVRQSLLQRVSAHARPPYSDTLLLEQLQIWRLLFASKALARAMQPLSCMSVWEMSKEMSLELAMRLETMEDMPFGPIVFALRSNTSRPFVLDPRHWPMTTPTSGPAAFLLRSRCFSALFLATPSSSSTHPAVPSALLLTHSTSREWLLRNI
mmetsp:Transcript_45320/g.113636  ORF Transcript_45320/g.113636 Transcript_45320/m.113636 type:complete len:239 (+) Transcript_45320:860-1576(+)